MTDASQHQSVIRLEDDWYIPTCTCGWGAGPVPDLDIATDVLMGHAYERGVAAEVFESAQRVKAGMRTL